MYALLYLHLLTYINPLIFKYIYLFIKYIYVNKVSDNIK